MHASKFAFNTFIITVSVFEKQQAHVPISESPPDIVKIQRFSQGLAAELAPKGIDVQAQLAAGIGFKLQGLGLRTWRLTGWRVSASKKDEELLQAYTHAHTHTHASS